MALQARPYCFQVDDSPQDDRNLFFYPRSVENACWESFVTMALGSTLNEQGIEFVPVRERCEHLTMPYPDGPASVKMFLRQLTDDCATLLFEHYANSGSAGSPCVRSETTIACVQRFGKRVLPSEWPPAIRSELERLQTAPDGVSTSRGSLLIAWIRSFFS
jgi:acyl-CoA thioesterase FadM